MQDAAEINTKNLLPLARGAGFRTIGDLAARIGRSRVTVHRAVSSPHHFGPTYKKLKKALHV
jgi:hypothetical protein